MDTTVAVTGAASGLGREIASELLLRGCPVVLVDRDHQAMAATGIELSRRFDASVSQVVADLSTIDGIRAAASELADIPEIGGLVNNAGGWLAGDQYPMARPETWLSAVTLNLLVPMLLTQLLWPSLALVRGGVVNIGSSGGLGDNAYGSPEYGAAKAGVRRFSSSLSSREDVRVMAIVPGWIGLDRAEREWAAMTPEQRQGAGPPIPPEHIARAVVMLLLHGKSGEVVEILQ